MKMMFHIRYIGRKEVKISEGITDFFLGKLRLFQVALRLFHMMVEACLGWLKLLQWVIFFLVEWDFFDGGKGDKMSAKLYPKTHYIASLKKEFLGSACLPNI